MTHIASTRPVRILLPRFLHFYTLVADISALELSSDCLSLVLELLALDEIFALWFTGASSMRRTLSTMGAWRTFVIDEDSYMGCIDTWPHQLLSSLAGLRTLSLRPSSPARLLPRLKVHYDDLLVLSRGLASLELAYIDAICDDDVGALPPSLTRLLLPCNKRISPNGLAKLPTSLTYLDLRSNSLIREAHLLPRNLVGYRGCPWALTPSDSFASDLPPGLASLNLLDGSPTLDMSHAEDLLWHWKHLSLLAPSPSLTRLDISLYLRELPLNAQYIDWAFPSNLEVLHVQANEALPPAALRHLPRELKKLKLKTKAKLQWEDKDILDLPSGLLHLEHWSLKVRAHYRPGSDPQLTLACFDLVPRGLLSLVLEYAVHPPAETDRKEDDYFQYLPSSLRKLLVSVVGVDSYWTHSPHISPDMLPPSLTRYLGTFSEPAISNAKSAPLRFPDVGVVRYLGQSETNFLFSEDEGKLQYYASWFHDGILRMTLDVTFLTDLQMLPSRLLTLVLNRSFHIDTNCDQAMLHLPDTLTWLEVSDTVYITDEALPALPHGLLVFKVPWEQGIRGNIYPFPRKLKTLNLGSASLIDYAPLFPRFLTDLELNSPSVTERTLSSLPKTLTSLKLRATDLRFLNASLIFPSLPHSLLRLEIRSKIAYMEDQDIADLPRGLVTFTALESGGSLTDASATLWPPRLQDLQFAGDSYSFSGLVALPKTLRMITMPKARFALPPPPGEATAPHFGSFFLQASIGEYDLPPHLETPP